MNSEYPSSPLRSEPPHAVVICSFPMLPQQYPASARAFVIRVQCSGRLVPPRIFEFIAEGYYPLRKLARLGVQTGFCAYAQVSAVPSEHSLSRFGVSM